VIRLPIRRPAAGRAAAGRRVALLTALTFAVTSLGLLATPTMTFAWDHGSFSSSSESSVQSMQNQVRASAGKRTLSMNSTLRSAARWRAKDMIERDYFSHTILGTSRTVFWYLKNKYNFCYTAAGENLGTVSYPGADEATVTEYIFKKWMASSGHKTNIMDSRWTVVGVGAYRGDGDKYMWAVLFAKKCSSSPTSTPKPTPKATAKPRSTPKPTPKPTRKPTPKPTAVVPATATPTLVPPPTPTPAATATAPPTEAPTPTATPAPTPPPQPVWGSSGGMRVLDPPGSLGLVDTIFSTVAAQYFGG